MFAERILKQQVTHCPNLPAVTTYLLLLPTFCYNLLLHTLTTYCYIHAVTYPTFVAMQVMPCSQASSRAFVACVGNSPEQQAATRCHILLQSTVLCNMHLPAVITVYRPATEAAFVAMQVMPGSQLPPEHLLLV